MEKHTNGMDPKAIFEKIKVSDKNSHINITVKTYHK